MSTSTIISTFTDLGLDVVGMIVLAFGAVALVGLSIPIGVLAFKYVWGLGKRIFGAK